MRVCGFATYRSLWGVSDQSVRRRSAEVQDIQAAAGIDTSKPPGIDAGDSRKNINILLYGQFRLFRAPLEMNH